MLRRLRDQVATFGFLLLTALAIVAVHWSLSGSGL